MEGGIFFHTQKHTPMSFQCTTLIGHIGQDCQIRTLDGGRVVTSFSVAYTETWKNQAGEKQERTQWFNCSYFTATTPGVAEYLRKGALVCVTGRVSARAYLNQAQQAAASLELNVGEIKLLSTPKREEGSATTPLPNPNTVLPSAYREEAYGTVITKTQTPAEGDDLPF